MLDIIRIRLRVKITPERNLFSFYYNSNDAYFENVCYLKLAKRIYYVFDCDSKEENEIYIFDNIFKLPKNLKKAPKLSYVTHIYYQGTEIKTRAQILEIEVWKNEEKVKYIKF